MKIAACTEDIPKARNRRRDVIFLDINYSGRKRAFPLSFLRFFYQFCLLARKHKPQYNLSPPILIRLNEIHFVAVLNF